MTLVSLYAALAWSFLSEVVVEMANEISLQFSDLLTHLTEVDCKSLKGEFQAGQIFLSSKDETALKQSREELLSTIDGTICDLFEKFYEEEDLDIDDYYGSFELSPSRRKISLTIHLETEEEISLSFPYYVEDFRVDERKITFSVDNISENPSFLLTEDEENAASLSKEEISDIFTNKPNRVSFYTVGMGGDGYSELYAFNDNITITTDDRYDWDFSDEIEAIFIAVDFDVNELRIVREIHL